MRFPARLGSLDGMFGKCVRLFFSGAGSGSLISKMEFVVA